MRSRLPKVLHPIGGTPIIRHIVNALSELADNDIALVHAPQPELLRQHFADRPDLIWIEQAQALGTGHAVQQALPLLHHYESVLVLVGDVALIQSDSLERLRAACRDRACNVLSAQVSNPYGYGRIIRQDGVFCAIVEEKDATPEQRSIHEVNSGLMAFQRGFLERYLPQLQKNPHSGEYYLTDLIAFAAVQNSANAILAANADEIQGVNTKNQLAQVETIWQNRQRHALMQQGLTLLDPTQFYVYGTLRIGQDVCIEPSVIIKGEVELGDRVYIETGCVLENCRIGADSRILNHSRIEASHIDEEALIGPFARIRPKTHVHQRAKVGNFVELKACELGEGSKASHLSYLGDSRIGQNVNIGAGTITCNYDGISKHATCIRDNCFIGSNTALVAPIEIGENSTIGAGSTLSHDVPADSLVFNRAPVRHLPAWKRKK